MPTCEQSSQHKEFHPVVKLMSEKGLTPSENCLLIVTPRPQDKAVVFVLLPADFRLSLSLSALGDHTHVSPASKRCMYLSSALSKERGYFWNHISWNLDPLTLPLALSPVSLLMGGVVGGGGKAINTINLVLLPCLLMCLGLSCESC